MNHYVFDADQPQPFSWNFAYHDHVAKLRDWATRNARDKKAVEEAAAKQLAKENVLSENESAAIMKELLDPAPIRRYFFLKTTILTLPL